MLDLSAIGGFYELKWFDGHVIHLKKPTEGFLRKIQSFVAVEDSMENMENIKSLVHDMVRDNEEGRVFSDEEMQKLDYILCVMIMKDYMQTVEERLGE